MATESSAVRRVVSVSFLLLSVLVPLDRAIALDLSDWVPGLRVTPFLAERVEYESNIFRTPSHARDDVIFRTIPGVVVEYGSGVNTLSLGYRAEILNFLTLSSQDAVHHLFAGQLQLDLNRFRIRIRDDFVKTTDPQNLELTGRIESTTNTFGASAEYRLTDRLGVGVNGSSIHTDYPTLPELSRAEYLAGVSVFWRVLPKADVQLGYDYGHKDFKTTLLLDVDRHIFRAGLRGELTTKLSTTFRLGYEIRDSQQRNVPGYQGFIMGGDWVYRPTERLTITLVTERDVQESSFGTQPYYISTTGTLFAIQQLGAKLAVNLRVMAGSNSYPGKETFNGQTRWRYDTLLGWGGGIGYDIQRWLRAGVEFVHTMRDSNFPQFSYQDDKIAGTITLQF